MRYRTRIALITILATLAACGGDSPAGLDTDGGDHVLQLAGAVYDLTTIDGAPLPVPDGTRSGCTGPDGTEYARTEVRVSGMELAFVDSGLFALSVSTQARCLADDWTTPMTDWSSSTETRSGTYSSDGASGTLFMGAATFPFVFTGQDLTVHFLPSMPYTFRRR